MNIWTSRKIGIGLLLVASAVMASASDRDGNKYAYVTVTGSFIPQKVKIHRIGTKTASPVRVYDRQEIDQMGRFTTEDVLAEDPSINTIRGRPGGGH
jgi:hypothetical protein